MDFPRFLAQGAEWVMVSFIDVGDREWLLPGRQKPRFTSKHSWPVLWHQVLWSGSPYTAAAAVSPARFAKTRSPGPALAFLIRIWGET